MRPSVLSVVLVCIGLAPLWAQSDAPRSASEALSVELRSSASSPGLRFADAAGGTPSSGALASGAPVISSGKTAASSPRNTETRRTLSDNEAPVSEPKLPVASDQAWTGGVGQMRDAQPAPAASVLPKSSSPAPGPASGAVSRTNSSVVPAQFTSTEPSMPGFSAEAASVVQPTGKALTLKPPSSSESVGAEHSTGTFQMIVSVGSSLLIVLGLIVGAAWCYRKASPTASSSLPKDVLQVLGRAPLAPRQQLVLLRFNNKLVLVSNLQGEVRTISEITDPLEVDRVAGICESSQAGSISDSFRSVLHNLGRSA